MSKVTLTHDAIELLTNYRWPGNIRQLKNIAETVSALEGQKLSPVSGRCEVNAATLSKYLPHDNVNSLPVRYQDNSGEFTQDEKQEIYKALYSLNAEVKNLKKIIASGQFHMAEPQQIGRAHV